ncbi:hypothetical protein NKH77_49815 [Streptomyces sp. M19]
MLTFSAPYFGYPQYETRDVSRAPRTPPPWRRTTGSTAGTCPTRCTSARTCG